MFASLFEPQMICYKIVYDFKVDFYYSVDVTAVVCEVSYQCFFSRVPNCRSWNVKNMLPSWPQLSDIHSNLEHRSHVQFRFLLHQDVSMFHLETTRCEWWEWSGMHFLSVWWFGVKPGLFWSSSVWSVSFWMNKKLNLPEFISANIWWFPILVSHHTHTTNCVLFITNRKWMDTRAGW